MQKNIFNVLISFLGVACVVLGGAVLGYRLDTIPELKQSLRQERLQAEKRKEEETAYIQNLEQDLELAKERQYEAENLLAEKLAEEERIRLEEERKAEEARLAAERKAAAEARAAAAAAEAAKAKDSKAS